jgi:hypothetical protein
MFVVMQNRKSTSTPKESQFIKEDVSVEHEVDDTESVSCVDDLAELAINVASLPKSVSFDSVDSEISDDALLIPNSASLEEGKDKPDNITISRFDGSITVSGSMLVLDVEANAKQQPASEKSAVHDMDDGNEWETVEVRNKINKKKGAERFSFSNTKYTQHLSSNMNGSGGNSKKQKFARQLIPKRKQTAFSDRKLPKDTSNVGVEGVEDEARIKVHIPSPHVASTGSSGVLATRPVGNPWKNGPPGNGISQNAKQKSQQSVDTCGKEKTLRDVVLGTHRTIPKQPFPSRLVVATEKTKASILGEVVSSLTDDKDSSPTKKDMHGRGSFNQLNLSGDQNTAPTYQETVSAVSTTSNLVQNSTGMTRIDVQRILKSDSSSRDDEDLQRSVHQPVTLNKKEGISAPPLPILLRPENANSATSSVASSLEAPHVVYTPHHSKSAPRKNDVGYHLLDVCDRLSRDMDVFMSRRAIALEPRRQERGALLAALQDSISSIWPNRCHAELYGSCAIQLDLPSSDLDVVVVGLDRLENEHDIPNADNTSSLFQPSDTSKPRSLNHYVHMPDMLNGERVMLLAEKLESQAWAVQVKAIPTASVPVVKILADPSRVIGSSGVREWIPLDVDECSPSADNKSTGHLDDNSPNSLMYGTAIPFLPWRGLDVMKGLLALDITFEGYGHGGIGSTVFSSRIVDEACLQSGLQPDSTPFVQVLMVLKELLAQRNLNEPYSGGLSSYALLLLLLALVRERDAIKDEIDRVETQKRAMTAADSASFCTPPIVSVPIMRVQIDVPKSTSTKSTIFNTASFVSQGSVLPSMAKALIEKSHVLQGKNLTSTVDTSKSSKPVSSWATVAKKASGSKPVSSGVSMTQQTYCAQNGTNLLSKPSFADAVSKSPAANGKSGHSTPVAMNRKKITQSKIEDRKDSNTESAIKSTTDAASTHDAKGSGTHSKNDAIIRDQIKQTAGNVTTESSVISMSAPYPQGVNDIIEVLCTGETTAGKLLMHFLLFYGQYFDAHTTAIDISGKHPRDFEQCLSPFLQRRAPGSIDPYTGMLIVDPIVAYDPLEGAEQNNVARRCFAWNSVRRLFLQSYETLSSAVERSATPPLSPSSKHIIASSSGGGAGSICSSTSGMKHPDRRVTPLSSGNGVDVSGDPWDTKSPLLSCLLSF